MATLLFVIFWVLLGLAILFVAMRGGPGGARRALAGEGRTGRRVAGIAFAAFYVAIGAAVPTLIVVGDRGSTAVAGTGVRLNDAQERGRQLFGTECGQCHVLAASKTAGLTGPNLDVLVGGIQEERARRDLVLNAIRQGRQRGNGTMPAQLLQGQQAVDTAAYVAAVAGK